MLSVSYFQGKVRLYITLLNFGLCRATKRQNEAFKFFGRLGKRLLSVLPLYSFWF